MRVGSSCQGAPGPALFSKESEESELRPQPLFLLSKTARVLRPQKVGARVGGRVVKPTVTCKPSASVWVEVRVLPCTPLCLLALQALELSSWFQILS